MDEISAFLEQQRIQDVVTTLFLATDARDWKAVVDCFTPQVLFDASAVTGAPAAVTPAKEIAAGWERGLAPITAVHHQAGNFRISLRGDEADAFCYAVAFHYRKTASGRNTRTFAGSYDLGMRRIDGRWRIATFRLNLKFVDGNLELEKG